MLGAKLGVKKAAVQKYESGRVINLKQETIKKLADIFDVPPTTFLNFSDWDKYAKEVNLAEQVKTLELIQKHFGDGAVELIHIYSELSLLDQKKLVQDAEKLSITHGKVDGLN